MIGASAQLGAAQLGLVELGAALPKASVVPPAGPTVAIISQTDLVVIVLPDAYRMMNFKPEN
jgi:hypothetical protein